MKYQFVEDLTSDVMFEAYGKDLNELFTNSAEALFEVICKTDKIVPSKEVTLHATAASEQELLYEWLSTALTESEVEGLFFSKFEIEKIDKGKDDKGKDKYCLTAKAWGEEISVEKGETVVKAVTYYGFKLEKTEEGYLARVSMDI